QRCADQDPESARKKAKLRSQHGANQWSGSGNRRKMMSKHHPAIRWHVIFVVISHNCRRGALLIQHEHFGREPFAVKTVADRESAEPCDDDPQSTELFSA